MKLVGELCSVLDVPLETPVCNDAHAWNQPNSTLVMSNRKQPKIMFCEPNLQP